MTIAAEVEASLSISIQVADSVSVHFSGRTHYVAITSATTLKSAGSRFPRGHRTREAPSTLAWSPVLSVCVLPGCRFVVRPDDRG